MGEAVRTRVRRNRSFVGICFSCVIPALGGGCDWEPIDPLIERRGAFLFVQVVQIPAAARTALVHAQLDQVPANEEVKVTLTDKESYSVGLRLAEPLAGIFHVDVGAFDAAGCLLATGSGAETVTIGDDPDDDTFAIAVPMKRQMTQQMTQNTSPCAMDDPLLFSAALRPPDANQGLQLALQGWGFRPGLKVTIGSTLQPPPRILSFHEAIIESPQLGTELGPVSVGIVLPDQRRFVLENALTLN